jgi:hypothetical protein
MKTTITEYEIETHGIDYPDYFQGAGTSFTRFSEIATGCGDTEKEALDDALEQMAMCGVTISPELEADAEKADDKECASERNEEDGELAEDQGESAYWYVSVRYNLA